MAPIPGLTQLQFTVVFTLKMANCEINNDSEEGMYILAKYIIFYCLKLQTIYLHLNIVRIQSYDFFVDDKLPHRSVSSLLGKVTVSTIKDGACTRLIIRRCLWNAVYSI